MLTLHIEQILTQIAAFIIMFWVLRRYAWQPLLNVLDARKAAIAKEFHDIKEEKKVIEQLKKEYHEKLNQISSEAKFKVEEGIEQGKARALKIEEEAHLKAEALVNKARDDIELEVAKGKEHLKKDVVNMAVSLTQKILSKNLDEKTQKELLSEFIQKAELE